jgi:single-strand DNA-binding protein
MSRSVNKVTLMGSTGKDPEVRFLPSGAIVASVSLATNERYKDKQGEWQDRAEWHQLVAYERLAEILRDYVKKGSKLYVEGRIQTRSWDKDGVAQYRTEIHVRELILLDQRPETREPAVTIGGTVSVPHRTLTEELTETEISDLDIPF